MAAEKVVCYLSVSILQEHGGFDVIKIMFKIVFSQVAEAYAESR